MLTLRIKQHTAHHPNRTLVRRSANRRGLDDSLEDSPIVYSVVPTPTARERNRSRDDGDPTRATEIAITISNRGFNREGHGRTVSKCWTGSLPVSKRNRLSNDDYCPSKDRNHVQTRNSGDRSSSPLL